MSRCTGQCCTQFMIDMDALTSPDGDVIDGDYIRDMLILIEPNESGIAPAGITMARAAQRMSRGRRSAGDTHTAARRLHVRWARSTVDR